jgi:hypothetical protein
MTRLIFLNEEQGFLSGVLAGSARAVGAMIKAEAWVSDPRGAIAAPPPMRPYPGSLHRPPRSGSSFA